MSGYSYADLKAEGHTNEGTVQYLYTEITAAADFYDYVLDPVLFAEYSSHRAYVTHDKTGSVQFQTAPASGSYSNYGTAGTVASGAATQEVSQAVPAGTVNVRVRVANTHASDTAVVGLLITSYNKKV